MTKVQGRCHCGGVSIAVPALPTDVTQCGCSICRRIAALWAYYPVEDVQIEGETQSYVWGRRHIAFQRCPTCGCVMAWTPRGAYPECGVNARMLDGFDANAVRVIVEDDAST